MKKPCNRVHNLAEMLREYAQYVRDNRKKYLKYAVETLLFFLLGVLTAHFFSLDFFLAAFKRFLDLL